MTPAAPVTDPHSPEFGGDALADGGAAKWSITAIVGFILSFLLVLAPLGVLLGVVGLFRTKEGSRKGRGLAVAAIPIGLLDSAVTGLIIFSLLFVRQIGRVAGDATKVLKTSKLHISETAADFYDQYSRRFQLAVSGEVFEKWLAGVNGKHGSLLNIKRTGPFLKPEPGGEFTINYTGEFVNGAANIAVTVGMPNGYRPEVFNIAVDGVSAIPESKPSVPESKPSVSESEKPGD